MLVVLTNIPTPYRTAFFNVLNALLKNVDIDFHVIYCAKTEPGRFWEFHPEENSYNYTFLSGWHPTFKKIYPHFNFGLLKTLQKLKPKYLLVAGSWNSPATINVLLNKKKINSKVIFWSEGHQDAQRSNNKLINFVRNKIFESFDAFVVPNNKSKLYIKKFNSNAPIGFLPNTIDENFYQLTPYNNIEDLKNKYNFKKLSRTFICIATLSDRKGVFELIQAYNSLDINDKENTGLVFVGTGELLQKMTDYKNEFNLDNVYILGHQTKEVVKELLSICDIFILPTKQDPNPLSPIEASFMKKPLVISNFAGNCQELVVLNKNGLILNEISAFCIKDALKYFINKSDSELREMGEFSYLNANRLFLRNKAAKSLIDFLSNI